jgi:hypothetical protein
MEYSVPKPPAISGKATTGGDLSRVTRGKNPIYSFIEVAEDPDSGIACEFAMDFKHSGKPVLKVVLDDDGAARSR